MNRMKVAYAYTILTVPPNEGVVNASTAATANGTYDEAKVRTVANNQAQVIAQLLMEKEKIISNVYQNVLTPDQRVKADALRQRMADRIGKHLQEQTTESKPTQ